MRQFSNVCVGRDGEHPWEYCKMQAANISSDSIVYKPTFHRYICKNKVKLIKKQTPV